MKNLSEIVTAKAVISAIEHVIKNKIELRPATKYHLVYKKKKFPPKEIVRIAAKKMGIYDLENYRLNGGNNTNLPLIKMGFQIEQFAEWENEKRTQIVLKNEERIARLTYNSHGWIHPSGKIGKSKTKSYEKENGYGHEEWLFDFTKVINGYKYGFLEPINKSFSKYVGKIFDLYLYTIDSVSNEKYWVGKLNNVTVISSEKSREVKKIYQKKGWFQEMKHDLENIGLSGENLDKWDGSALFNISFKEEDFEQYPEKTLIQNNDISVSSYYYVLLKVIDKPKIVSDADGEFILGRCNPNSRFGGKMIKRTFEKKTIEFPFIHHQISIALEKILRKEFDVVYAENQTGYKTSIDIVAKKGKRICFYEIKTYNDVKMCIRQAVGQLLEYSYFPNKQLATEIFIVTPHKLSDKNLIDYIKNLKVNVGLPIGYIYYDLTNKKVGQVL